MRRFNNNGRGRWGASRPDTFPNGSSRRQYPVGCRDPTNYQRQQFDESEFESRPMDEMRPDDSVGNKLDRLMDRMDKLDAWREETDRRFEDLELAIPRVFSHPLDCDDDDEWEYEDYRRKRNWNSNHHMGSVQTRRPTCWYPPGDRPLPSCQLYDPPQSRRPPCWEPHPRRASREYSDSSYVPPRQPHFTNMDSSSIFGQSHFTNMDSSYVPPRQYKTSTIRQPTYSSDVPPRNPHAEFHQWRHEYKPSRSTSPSQAGRRRLAAPQPVAAAPLPPMRSVRPPKQPSPALPTELPPSATPGAYRPLQPLPVTTPTLAADPHPQSVVPIPMKKEGKLLDEVPSPPAVFSASCNPDISVKEETLLEDGVARERKTVDGEKETAIVKETILLNGDESGLMKEAMNCLREVSYPSVMVYALTCAGGSEITREDADGENDDIITRITLIRLCAFDPGICVSFSKRNWEFLAMHMEAMDLQVEDEKLHIDNALWSALNMLPDDDKELPHGGFMKCLLATKTFNIGLNMPAKPVVFTNVQDFDGDYYVGRRLPIWRVFDPGGDASPKLLLPTIVVAS